MEVDAMAGGTVLFVCQHGAGKSRMAAAWFNGSAPDRWRATSAGIEPQREISQHAPRLLAGTAAEPLLDNDPPRPLSAVPNPTLVIAIDCDPPPGSGGHRWDLSHQRFDAAMCAELRDRARELASALAGEAGRP